MSNLSIRRVLYGGVAAAAAVTGLVVAGPAGPALAAGEQGAAFVLSYDPSPALYTPYTPAGPSQYNSASPGNPDNTVTRLATGEYLVRIPDLVGFGATHATAYGGDAAYCNSGVTVASTAALVGVMCFKADGTRTDHMFALSFTNVTDSAQAPQLAYLEVESDGTVWPSRQFNSAGPLSTVTRSGSSYLVRIPGLGAIGGHVQVSGADDQGSRCKVVGWGPDATDQLVNVQCFHAGGFGVAENAPFILTYVNQQNILGLPTGLNPAGHVSAYGWADQPTATPYPPDSWYLFSSTGYDTMATRTDVGVYGMTFDGVEPSLGNVQVTAYGPGQEFCNLASVDADIQVRCFDWDGTPVDTRYTVAFTGS